MPSIADLYADVGFRVDKGELRQADGAISHVRRGLASLSKPAKGGILSSMLGGISSGASKLRGGINRAGGKALGAVTSGIGMGIGMGITSKLTESVTGIMDVERALTRFKLEGVTTTEEMAQFRAELGKQAGESGIAREELLKSAATYQMLSGDSAGARENVGLFAKVANASGAEMEDIARVAYSMRQNLQIDPAGFEKGFSALMSMSEMGSIGLAEVAENAAELAPLMGKFAGGSGMQGLTDMGAAFQVVATGAGSAAQASTQLQALMGAFVQGSKKLKAGGFDVFNRDAKGNKTLKSFREILDGIADSEIVKDPRKLQEALGSKEALAAFMSLSKNKDKLDEITASAERGDMVQRKAEEYRASAAARFDASIERLKVGIADVFSPERITTFVNGLEQVIAAAGRVGEALAKLPGLGRDIGSWAAENDSGTALGLMRQTLGAARFEADTAAADESSRRARIELGRARAGDVSAIVQKDARAAEMSRTLTAQITVNGTTNPAEVAKQVNQQIATWWNAQIHDADASATAGAPP